MNPAIGVFIAMFTIVMMTMLLVVMGRAPMSLAKRMGVWVPGTTAIWTSRCAGDNEPLGCLGKHDRYWPRASPCPLSAQSGHLFSCTAHVRFWG